MAGPGLLLGPAPHAHPLMEGVRMSTTVDHGSPAPAGIDDATATVVGLRTGDDSGLPTVGTASPAPAWRVAGDRNGIRQTAYEIEVAADPGFGTGVERVGPVESARPLHIPWPAAPLRSREVRWWRVRVRTDAGWTAWS